MAERQADWPHAMTALSTHDTKRGEDVRARITALAEAPELWATTLDTLLEAAPLPDPAFGSLLWQAALGAWPISRERLHAYAEKAMREAGDRTTWTDPDPAYEAAVHAAVDAAFDDPRCPHAPSRSSTTVSPRPGWPTRWPPSWSSLTMPGVPDVYQGSELWEQSLVDPDNRRPVDFDAAAASLADGSHAKQAITAQALRLRRDRPELFTGYTPLMARGACRRARAGLRPRRRGHGRDPAAARARRQGRLGRHHPHAGRRHPPGRRPARRQPGRPASSGAGS